MKDILVSCIYSIVELLFGGLWSWKQVNFMRNIEGLHGWGLCVEVHLTWNGSYAGPGHGTLGGCNADRRTSHPPMVTRNTPDLGKQKLQSLLDLDISLVWDSWISVIVIFFFIERFSRQTIFMDLPLSQIVLYFMPLCSVGNINRFFQVWGGAIVGCGIAIQGVSQSEKVFQRVYSILCWCGSQDIPVWFTLQCGSQVGRLYSQYSIETHSSAVEFRTFPNISISASALLYKVFLNQIFIRVVALLDGGFLAFK